MECVILKQKSSPEIETLAGKLTKVSILINNLDLINLIQSFVIYKILFFSKEIISFFIK